MYTESEIITGCKQHSAPHQRMLYTLHAPVLKSVCVRYIKDRDEAKDVLQDGFIKIFNSISSYKGEGSFEGWLKRIVIHVALDHIKKKGRLPVDKNESWESVEENQEALEFSNSELLLNAGFSADDLMEILNAIPQEFALVFNLFYIDGMAHKDIGDLLQIGGKYLKEAVVCR